MRAGLFPTAIAALVVALVGCGGSSNGSLSSAELVRKADAVCKDVNDRTNALPAPTDIKSASGLLRKTVAILGPALERLRALEPPSDLRRTYDAWVVKNAELVGKAKQAQASAARGNANDLRRAIADASKIHNQADRLATKVGLRVCSARHAGT